MTITALTCYRITCSTCSTEFVEDDREIYFLSWREAVDVLTEYTHWRAGGKCGQVTCPSCICATDGHDWDCPITLHDDRRLRFCTRCSEIDAAPHTTERNVT